jgi:DNA-directed RNA polymerase alpha subunit
MSDKEKSTDPGLTALERKNLRSREAKEAIDDHEKTQKALHGNLERLRAERLKREAATGPMLYPAPEIPDSTPIEHVRFQSKIGNALSSAGMKTIGDVRGASDTVLLKVHGFGKGSVAQLRKLLGLKAKK